MIQFNTVGIILNSFYFFNWWILFETVPSQLLAIPSNTQYFIFWLFIFLIFVSVDYYIIIMINNSLNIVQWLFWWSTFSVWRLEWSVMESRKKVLHHLSPMLSTYFESLTFKVMHWHDKVYYNISGYWCVFVRLLKIVGYASNLFLWNPRRVFLLIDPDISTKISDAQVAMHKGVILDFWWRRPVLEKLPLNLAW